MPQRGAFGGDETITFCLRRLGHATALLVGDLLRDPVVDLVRVEARDEDAAWRLPGQRDDKRYSFTDRTSFAVMQRIRRRLSSPSRPAASCRRRAGGCP